VPELTIDTTKDTVATAAARVAALAQRLARRPSLSAATEGSVLWVTGRPGSGKTTVVSGVAERVRAGGAAVTVLDPAEFVAIIARGETPSLQQAEISTRALVLAAKHLSEAGVATMIDGVAPLREGIQLAREVIASFALVELACPADICRTRERTVRWGLVPFPDAPRPAAAPSLGLEYEPAVAPDLVLYTDAVDRWTTVEEVMHLVQRLAGDAHRARRPCA
jgi:adenylylsulfate kinase-like enzyme